MRRRCCAASQRPRRPVMRAQGTNRFHDSPLAIDCCPAGRSAPGLLCIPRHGVTQRCCVRRCDLAVSHATLRCARASLRTDGLERCGPRCCAAPRRPKMPAPRAQFTPDSPRATPRCPAGSSRPTCSLRPSPAVAVCTDAAAPMRRRQAI